MEPDRLPASAESLPPQTVQNSPARAILRTRRLQAIGPLDPATQRLNYPFFPRLGLASAIACSTGMLLGTSHGAQTAALRFRAENSHRLPNNERGWYLYHKTKNYYVIVQSAKEGFRMAKKIGIWTAVFFGIEEIVDRGRVGRAYIQRDADGNWKNQRRRKDFISTVTAGMVTSAAFSLWSESMRMGKKT